MTNRDEVIWAAGFFDGEGHIGVNRHRSGRLCLQITIGQAGSPECLERFQKAAGGVGSIYGPYKPGKNSKQEHYQYRVYTDAGVTHIVDLLWDHLSGPKKKQIEGAKRRIWIPSPKSGSAC